MSSTRFQLYGRVILNGKIEALTGLHIGGSPGALAIGGVDLPVIRNSITQQPYIPGSSIKGKMRSLWEKSRGVRQNTSIGRDVNIHVCKTAEEYALCPVCQIYGSTGDSKAVAPTRIIVRDVALDVSSMQNARTDLPYSEIKWEAAIDRVTSAATPRQIERVPAGAVFDHMQIVFNIFEADDLNRFLDVLTALDLVEDDYLGGHGSRGSGRVAFRNLSLVAKRSDDYSNAHTYNETGVDLSALLQDRPKIITWLKEMIPVDGGS
jgi:CRISPR-associated protein Csm3